MRKRGKLTLAGAAKQIGCDRSYLSKIESGVARQPSTDFMRKVATVFRVNQEWLTTGLGEPQVQLSTEGQEQLERDAQFLAALSIILQEMTLLQLSRSAKDVSDSSSIGSARKAFWLRTLADWIGVKSRSKEEVQRAVDFELARSGDVHYKWIKLMPTSRTNHWEQLRRRIGVATDQRGSRAKLARDLGVTPQALNEWLQGRNAPPAENTLRLLRWVEEAEAKTKDAGSAETRPARKTRKSKSTKYEQAKSSQKK
jgi:transcriptional regulator with XRE-family HTH domain